MLIRSALCVLTAALAIPAFSQGPRTRIDLPTGTNGANAAATGDCNGDGVLDIFTTNRSGTASVFIGNADGSYQPGAVLNLGVNPIPVSIAAGRINTDNHIDLAIISRPVVLIANGNGDCTFTVQPAITTVANPFHVAVKDLNGDGKNDLVVSDLFTSTLMTLIGTGTGTFAAPISSTVGSFPYTFILGDFNGDGKTDVAAADPNANGIAVAAGDGSGSFVSPLAIVTGSNPQIPTIGDINGDGKPDLAVPNGNVDRVSILINSYSTPGGAMAFQPAVTLVLPTGSGPTGAELTASPNGDKQDQIIVPNFNDNSVSVFSNLANTLLQAAALGLPFEPLPTTYATGVNPVMILNMTNVGGTTVAVPTFSGLTTLVPNCDVSATPPNISFGRNPPVIAPGQYIEVNVPAGCAWTSTVTFNGAPVTHISATPPSGVGPQTVLIQTTANSGPARSARVTFFSGNRSSFTSVFQASNLSTCGDPAVDRTTLSAPQQGGGVAVNATVNSLPADGCNSAVGVTLPNLNITLVPAVVTNSGPVTFGLPANNGDTITFYGTVGANLIPITQTGNCAPVFGAYNGVVPAQGGAISLPYTLPDGCAGLARPAGLGATVNQSPNNVQVNIPASTLPSPRTGTVTIGTQIAQFIQKSPTPVQLFNDVPQAHPFFDWITSLRKLNITSGCTANTYCPDDPVTRGQMAVFMVRSIESGDNFPFSSTPYFVDVPANHAFFKWIQRLKELGITAGCTATGYCPDSPVTRGQMAVFLTRARLGVVAGIPVHYPGMQYFNDEPPADGFYAYIQNLKAFGITSGCTATDYCPGNTVTRGQMGVFLIRTFFTPYI